MKGFREELGRKDIKLFCQQMHYLLKHKMLQFLFKYLFIWLLNISVLLDHHQGAYIGTLLKLQSLSKGTETCRNHINRYLNTNCSILCFNKQYICWQTNFILIKMHGKRTIKIRKKG